MEDPVGPVPPAAVTDVPSVRPETIWTGRTSGPHPGRSSSHSSIAMRRRSDVDCEIQRGRQYDISSKNAKSGLTSGSPSTPDTSSPYTPFAKFCPGTNGPSVATVSPPTG